MSTKSTDPLLQKPLYVFALPEEILHTLQIQAELNTENLQSQTEQPDVSDQPPPPPPNGARPDIAEGVPAAATSCATCGLSFPTLQEQRDHIRSDLHGYNLKQKLRGQAPVGEKDFETLIGELDESISGSESSYSDTSEEETSGTAAQRKETTLSALLRKQANLAQDAEDDRPRKRKHGAGRAPLLWFSSSRLEQHSLGIYRAVFTKEEQIAQPSELVQILQKKQLTPAKPAQKAPVPDEEAGGVALPLSKKSITGPHYFLCMIGGGHFAAMVVSLTPTITRKGNMEDRSANVLAHKTFHRYTTRRKQGGSQSANDNSKGNAHSAGAGIRRYNETALVNDVRTLLAEWQHYITTAELIFIRATGTTNRRTLFGPYDGQVMTSSDPRIRSFPFSTRRATQAELMRAFVELTRVKLATAEELAAARQAAEPASRAPNVPAKPSAPRATKPKPSKDEEAALLHTSQLQALIRRNKAPALTSYLTTNALSPDFRFAPPDRPENHHAPTPLHLASHLGSAACVAALLTRCGANPGARNADGRTAAELAGERATRDGFRVARAELGEGRWAWDEVGVGAALGREEVKLREKEERAAEEGEREREGERRRAEVERLRAGDREREEAAREKRFGKGKSVGLKDVRGEMTGQEKRDAEARGMSDEMRVRLERERRARAAEARFAKK